MDSIKLYTIKPAYIDYLIPHAPHLFHNKAAGQHNERKYIGIVLHVGDMDYFAPLSSFKEKHKTIKEGLDFIKGYVHIPELLLQALPLKNTKQLTESAGRIRNKTAFQRRKTGHQAVL